MTDEEIKALIASSTKTAIDAAVKPINEALAQTTGNLKVIGDTLANDAREKTAAAEAAKAQAVKDAAAKADPAATAAGAAPLTLEQVQKQISDGIAAALKTQAAEVQSSQARNAFIAEKLKGVPAAYAAKLGNDPAKWAEQEQAIRGELKADLASIGATVKDVSGGNPGGATASAGTDAEKITQFKAQGLSDGAAEFAANLRIPA
jgi:hypothetical protein